MRSARPVCADHRALPGVRAWWLAAFLPLLLAALAASPAGVQAQGADRPLVVMLDSEPATLDPFLATDAYGVRLSHQLLHDTLLTLGDDLEVAPGLAERWEHPTPTRWVFHLKPDVRFQDGAPLQAADVVHTLRAFMAPETGSPYGAGLREKIAAVRATGPLAVTVELNAPYASFLADLILPVVARTTEPAAQGQTPLDGTGPYTLAQRSVGEIVLARNPDYHGEPPGTARVVFKVVTDDNTRLLKFRKGDIDLGINVLPLDKLAHFRRPPLGATYALKEAPGLSFQYLGFNLRDPVLGKARVRQAIARAIDVGALIKYRQAGHSTRATGLFPQGSPYQDGSLALIPYDPERARALLDAAGFPPGEDGVRFTLQYKTTTDRSAVVQARVIQDNLREVGIAVEVRSYEWATFYADVKSGNFQLYSLRWIGVFDPGFLYELLHSDKVPPTGRNRGRYSNPEVDRLLEQARVETDTARRRELYRQVHRLVYADLPYVPLWHNNNVAVHDKRLTGVRLHPSGGFEHLPAVHWADGG